MIEGGRREIGNTQWEEEAKPGSTASVDDLLEMKYRAPV